MTLKIHFKTGKYFILTNLDGDFESFCHELYTFDVKVFSDVCVRVSEIEYIEVL